RASPPRRRSHAPETPPSAARGSAPRWPGRLRSPGPRRPCTRSLLHWYRTPAAAHPPAAQSPPPHAQTQTASSSLLNQSLITSLSAHPTHAVILSGVWRAQRQTESKDPCISPLFVFVVILSAAHTSRHSGAARISVFSRCLFSLSS